MHTYVKYLDISEEKLFTFVMLPDTEGKFPTVIYRSPYVSDAVERNDADLMEEYTRSFGAWTERGYAIVFQHCRGQGKSTGGFVAYVHEREDGISLQEWIRKQSFYNGELFLLGGSYTASLHYTTAPFAPDIKGAVFDVQDSERYRLWYRNGQMRKGHANWHFALYKPKCGLKKSFDMGSFSALPLENLSLAALGERAEDFEQMLRAQKPSHPFWNTRFGGAEARGATDNTHVPILLTTGYNDFYVGGMFEMWQGMSDETKSRCAFLVSPYNHGDGYNSECGLAFPNGRRTEQFGEYHAIWIEHIRNGTPLPFEKGVVTYYRVFENRWESDFYAGDVAELALSLGEGTRTLRYDPKDPPAFGEEGIVRTEDNAHSGVITLHSHPFESDAFVKGRMRARLCVESDCSDTSFYVRISIDKGEYAYALRHDITSLCYQLGDYKPNTEVELDFCFDEYAFLINKGERLIVEIAATDNNSYVCHTNRRGEYYLQTNCTVATNKVHLDRSTLILPIEQN